MSRMGYALPTRCPVLTEHMVLCGSYGIPSTDGAYGAMRFLCDARFSRSMLHPTRHDPPDDRHAPRRCIRHGGVFPGNVGGGWA
eukprot:1465105-Rhodomonas_salina.8